MGNVKVPVSQLRQFGVRPSSVCGKLKAGLINWKARQAEGIRNVSFQGLLSMGAEVCVSSTHHDIQDMCQLYVPAKCPPGACQEVLPARHTT